MCVILAWVQSSIFSIANIKKKEKKKIPHQRYRLPVIDMRGSRKFFQRGSNFDYVFFFFFFLGGGGGFGQRGSKYQYKRVIIGPPVKRHLNGCPTLNRLAWLVAVRFYRRSGPVLLRNPIFLCFFGGRGVPTRCPPSGPAHD